MVLDRLATAERVLAAVNDDANRLAEALRACVDGRCHNDGTAAAYERWRALAAHDASNLTCDPPTTTTTRAAGPERT